MIYKTPNFADSLIIASFLLGLVSMLYLDKKYPDQVKQSELSKLEEEMKIERMKLSIEQLKENNLREKSIRDSRTAAMGYSEGKHIKF